MSKPPRTVPIMLIGLGNVGSEILRHILESQANIAARTGLRLVPVGLADISGITFNTAGLDPALLQDVLAATKARRLLEAVVSTRPLESQAIPSGVTVVDVTAARDNVPLLKRALAANSGAVLANKNPLTGPWQEVRAFFETPLLRYECTVGAGLPVIDSLQSLLDTGDAALRIEGCLSGTLGYLCAEMERGVSYSDAITTARTLGYTEPDPRDDLSGHDVARKALILARTAGWPLEMSDFTVEPLYSEALAALSVEDFMAAAHQLNADYAGRFQQAQSQGQTLRYVAQVRPDGGAVGLQAVGQDSPMWTLRGPANYVSLQTRRYEDSPMVIAGPGAGPEVTAAGVLNDIVRVARRMI